LTAIKPTISKPFKSIPVSGYREVSKSSSQDNSGAFKTLINAEMTNKTWELDEIGNQNKEKQW